VTGVVEDYAGPPPPAEPNRWLWSAFARSIRDNMMAEFVVQALRIGGMVILARALSPHDFGLLKILVVVATFATLANEAGIPDALIQRKDLTPQHQWTAWWMSIGLALLTSCILYGGAPGLARVMKIPELREGVRLLCIPFLLEGAAVTANAQLRRDLRFGMLATADVLGEMAFLIVALFLLWHGLPQWSLAAGLAARYGAHALSVLIAGGQVPRGLPRVRAARDLVNFAGKVFGGRMVDALSSNVDFLLIGRFLGSSALGFYSMAWDLLRFVPDRVFRIAGRVTFPACCKTSRMNSHAPISISAAIFQGSFCPSSYALLSSHQNCSGRYTGPNGCRRPCRCNCSRVDCSSLGFDWRSGQFITRKIILSSISIYTPRGWCWSL
jgi:O-antigen/teichoic acid export membrane protein